VEGYFSCTDDQIYCVLHLHKRVIEKVIHLLITRAVDELKTDAKEKRAAQFCPV
jgi:hypothetical protein